MEGRYQRSWQQWYRWKGFKCNYYSIMLIVFQNHESVWDALPSRLLYMLGMKSTTLPDYIAPTPTHPPQKRSFRYAFRCVKRTWLEFHSLLARTSRYIVLRCEKVNLRSTDWRLGWKWKIFIFWTKSQHSEMDLFRITKRSTQQRAAPVGESLIISNL